MRMRAGTLRVRLEPPLRYRILAGRFVAVGQKGAPDAPHRIWPAAAVRDEDAASLHGKSLAAQFRLGLEKLELAPERTRNRVARPRGWNAQDAFDVVR